ncbi:response regulator, partial [bacterium]|nr:response regulator [bacterium]
MKVLIADDEQDTLEFLSYNLRQANFTVLKSSDGIDALNKIKSENPDIAILDIMMPGIDGIDVCQEVRDSGNNNIIIVILSARNENYTKIAAYRAG